MVSYVHICFLPNDIHFGSSSIYLYRQSIAEEDYVTTSTVVLQVAD